MEDSNIDIIMNEFLIDFADISLAILRSKDLAEILIKCDKLELWLLAFYSEFAHLKEGD